jgi:DNA-binding CsgD family transcriptional regulator
VLQAIQHAIGAEDLLRGTTRAQIAEAAARLAGDHPADLPGLLLAGFAAFTTGGYEHGAPAMHRAISAFTDPDLPAEQAMRRFDIGATFCTLLWDDEARETILDRAEVAARRAGALHTLDEVHFMAAMHHAALGRLDVADRHDAVGQRLRQAIGITAEQEQIWRHPELVAWHGDVARETLLGALSVFEMLGVGAMTSVTVHGIALLDIARADYAAARDLLRPLVRFGEPGRYPQVLPDLVECALRSGDRQTAQSALQDLAVAVRAAGTPWATGLLARSRALLSAADTAETHYRDAITRLSATRAHGDLARAHLLFGEWLRRRRRRRDARAHLTTALAMFEQVRANAFAGRARQELRPLGGPAETERPAADAVQLTAQELAVSRLARDGRTNAEIATHLFVSASTVDYHLRKVYRKLDVRSRRELRGALHD